MGELTGTIFRFSWICAHCGKSNITEFKKRFVPLSFYKDVLRERDQLYEVIDDALNILGEEEHRHENECEGCRFDLIYAKKELVVGLARVDGEVCTHCDGVGYEPEPYKITTNPNGSECKHYAVCKVCKGTGVNKGYLPPSWKRIREYIEQNKQKET